MHCFHNNFGGTIKDGKHLGEKCTYSTTHQAMFVPNVVCAHFLFATRKIIEEAKDVVNRNVCFFFLSAKVTVMCMLCLRDIYTALYLLL